MPKFWKSFRRFFHQVVDSTGENQLSDASQEPVESEAYEVEKSGGSTATNSEFQQGRPMSNFRYHRTRVIEVEAVGLETLLSDSPPDWVINMINDRQLVKEDGKVFAITDRNQKTHVTHDHLLVLDGDTGHVALSTKETFFKVFEKTSPSTETLQ